MKIGNSIIYVGVNDREIDLFEGQYRVPHGMCYNSYIVMDEKIAIFDTVDAHFTHEWLDNIARALGDRKPDYLIVQHMEPDHSGSISSFIRAYPETRIVSNSKAFVMMDNFFGGVEESKRIVVGDGEALSLGAHTLTFVFAPMVHWPEVMLTYESSEGILFSADAFGKFGAMDADEPWDDEARRYYIGIVGKYGQQVQNVLKKASALDIRTICPLHGPILTENLSHYIKKYSVWSSYVPEDEGVVIAYTSVYGNTRVAALALAEKLNEYGCPAVKVFDLARSDMSEAVAAAFRYSSLVLATTTYNAGIFPYMRDFIEHLTERGFRSRKVGIIENGSWAPMAAKVIRSMLEGSRDISYLDTTCTIRSSLNDASRESLDAMARELCADYITRSSGTQNDPAALTRIGYGLYVVTSNDGKRDNGLIVNTVSQLTDSPRRIAVTINKENYSHHIIKQTGKMNVNCLSVDAPFSVFERFGFQSGRNVDKFAGESVERTQNGLVILPKYVNACMSLTVESYVDLGTHGMFICTVDEARVLSHGESMTYSYYHEHVKPKPDASAHGYVCRICGYVYEGDTLPDDFICPLCKHPASDFEPINQ